MRGLVVRRLICLASVIAAAVLIGYRGGSASFLLFWTVVLIPVTALWYRHMIKTRFLVAFRTAEHTILRGESTTAVLTLTNNSPVPITDIRLRLTDGKVRFLEGAEEIRCFLLPGEMKQMELTLRCLHCGETSAGAEEIRVRDLFGLTERRFGAVSRIHVMPRTEHLTDLVIAPVRQLERRSQSRSYYGDTIPDGQLRPYVSGEDVRRIHWKASQLQGRPILRNLVPEPKTEVVLLPDSRSCLPEGSARWLAEDSIIEGTLAVADYFLRSNIATRVVAGEDRVVNVYTSAHYLTLYELCARDLFTGEQRPDALMERDMVSRNPGSSYIVLTWDVDDRLIRTCSLCMDAGAEVTLLYIGEDSSVHSLAAAERRLAFHQVTSARDVFAVLSGMRGKEGGAE